MWVADFFFLGKDTLRLTWIQPWVIILREYLLHVEYLSRAGHCAGRFHPHYPF